MLAVPTALRSMAQLRASWEICDEVIAASPAELRKGPPGNGRDRDDIKGHVVEAERGDASNWDTPPTIRHDQSHRAHGFA